MPRLVTSSGAASGPLSLSDSFGLNTSMSASAQRAGIQNAIDSAISARRQLSLDYKGWKIDAPLVINGPLSLVGPAFQERWGTYAQGGTFADVSPHLSPPFVGSTITQMASSADIIQIPVCGDQVDLDGFGLMFNTPFASTGHGIVATPPAAPGGDLDNGIMGGNWRNISVYGHDGNHYAFEMWNAMYVRHDHLRGYGGGFLHFGSNTNLTYYGNLTSTDCYGALFLNGTAHCWNFDSVTSAFLDYTVLVRPQGWVTALDGHTAPVNQDCLAMPGAPARFFVVIAGDWETTTGAKVALPVGDAMTRPPVSGVAIQNASDMPQMYYIEAVMNPTGGAAADLKAEIGGVPQWGTGVYFPQGNLHVPAGGATGTVQSLNVLVPPWFKLKVTFSNCTIQNSGNWPVGGLAQVAAPI